MDSFRKWKENSVTKEISLRKQCLERNKYFACVDGKIESNYDVEVQ